MVILLLIPPPPFTNTFLSTQDFASDYLFTKDPSNSLHLVHLLSCIAASDSSVSDLIFEKKYLLSEILEEIELKKEDDSNLEAYLRFWINCLLEPSFKRKAAVESILVDFYSMLKSTEESDTIIKKGLGVKIVGLVVRVIAILAIDNPKNEN